MYNNDRRSNHQEGFVIINGRRIPVQGTISGHELGNAAGAGYNRRAAIVGKGLETQAIDPNRQYSPNDLRDRYGKPVKIQSFPDRYKGDIFDGWRSQFSKDLITEQVYDLAFNFAKGGVDFDEEQANWLVIPRFGMPNVWCVPFSPLMILFPTDYPNIPPIGFYLPESLQSPHGHLFNQAYHGASTAPTVAGWAWYCCYIKDGAWRPNPVQRPGDWKYGDNIWTYLTLIKEVLNGKEA
jgi:hypothetical protein